MDDSEKPNWFFVPDPWQAAREMIQDMFAPSDAIKEAARRSCLAADLHRVTGWLLLTHFGILLGSFGPIMSRSILWLSWSILILEAFLKLVRSWFQDFCFRDVPCAYVPLHQQYHQLVFGLYSQVCANLLVVGLYLPSWVLFIVQWKQGRHCYAAPASCVDGASRLNELLLVSCGISYLHVMCGSVASLLLATSIRRPRRESLEYLTWWVHLSRHPHLSAAAASAQPEICGLPGQWFDDVEQLKESLQDSLDSSHGPTLKGLRIMATQALLSLCKQGHGDKVLKGNGFELIKKTIMLGSIECRGLAAAIIGVLAAQSDVFRNANARVASAVPALKILVRSKEPELEEVALGALVNAILLATQREEVLSALVQEDALMLEEEPASFVELLLTQAKAAPTCRCQTLATSLLSQLLRNLSARNVVLTPEHRVVRLFSLLVQHSQTRELQAAAAGLLWELAYWAPGSLTEPNQARMCVNALVQASTQDHAELAANAAGALASIAYRSRPRKDIITAAGAIPVLVNLLQEDAIPKGKVQACRALWILADNYLANQTAIREAGAIPLLAKLVRRERDEDILVQAAWAISRLAVNCRENQEMMGAGDIIPSLVRLLKEYASRWNDHERGVMRELVLEKTALALGDIAPSNQEKIAGEEGAVECLVWLVQRSDVERFKVKVFVARALQKMAEGNQVVATSLVTRNALPALQALEGSTPNVQIQAAARDALNALSTISDRNFQL